MHLFLSAKPHKHFNICFGVSTNYNNIESPGFGMFHKFFLFLQYDNEE